MVEPQGPHFVSFISGRQSYSLLSFNSLIQNVFKTDKFSISFYPCLHLR